jgi:G3E family GTPase
VDLVDGPTLDSIEEELRAVNGEAVVLRCQRCEIDLARILSTGMYSSAGLGGQAAARALAGAAAGGGRQEPGEISAPSSSTGADPVAAAAGDAAAAGSAAAAAAAAGEAAAPHDHDHECTAACHHGGAGESRVHTVTLLVDGPPLDLHRLRHWMDELLWESTERLDLFRVKGLLHVVPEDAPVGTPVGARTAAATQAGGSEGGQPPPPRKVVLQGVHEIYDVVDVGEWRADERPSSKLVFIGRRLQREQLLQGVCHCQVVP